MMGVNQGNNHDDWRRPKDWSDAVHVGDIFLKIRGFVGPRDEKQIQSQFSSVGVKDQNELPPRSPKDSFSKAVLPLSSDVRFRRKCVTVFNGVRFGRILELMDAFAGLVAYRYVLNPAQISPSPFVLVTALVDRIVTRYGHGKNCVAAISANEDIFLSGFVSWVGKSSIEILVDVWQNDSLVTDAAFVFVSRDPVGLGPTPVNPLKIESPEDQHYFSKGAANTEMRKRFEENNLFRTLPNKEESELLHRQFLASVESRVFRGETDNRLVAARGGIYARDTQSENVMICHPEDKNLNNKIFGGRMMRQAFEHAWGVAMLHWYSPPRGRPRLVCIDDIWFRKPQLYPREQVKQRDHSSLWTLQIYHGCSR
ncbi:unnamed protein product [Notodromas monacha]|uniref:HotDog ACOT-type domain-containing protein n=1 Tax=Notodromas monacha TaxID=399045 RepID=A0A7R9GI48_9CRUS|nr:unnamed protein product [Notodromas monacha]CAG0923576.1 unnamed protein product [Notodromas monacha]